MLQGRNREEQVVIVTEHLEAVQIDLGRGEGTSRVRITARWPTTMAADPNCQEAVR